MKKKPLLTALLIVLFCGVWFLCLNQDKSQAANSTGVVTASMLNIRTGAGTSYGVLQSDGVSVQLESGTKVTILESSTGWYKISFTFGSKTLTGYASSDYIALDKTATATPAANATATPSSTAQTTYRYTTTYKAISVPAKTSKKAKLYKSDGKTRYTLSKKKITLSKKKSVKIIGEKLINNKKWFKVSFTYNKKTRKAYVRNYLIKMTLKTSANAEIYNLKSAAKVHTKAGAAAPYKKSNAIIVKILKGSNVQIVKEKMSNGIKWYQLSFTYNKKTMKGYVSSKYVKLIKKKVVTKTLVVALSEAQFEAAMTAQGFPDSYKPYLRVLHQQYPYWQFKSFKTGLQWSTALAKESVIGVNLISNSKAKAWKSTEAGAYDASTGKWKVFDGSTWVAASKNAIAYYMDPRNFLNERNVFQFESLEYQSEYQTKAGINTIISNTPFYNKTFTYNDLTTGAAKSIYFVDAFIEAAKYSGVSPYHLASRVKQEVVTSATTTSIAATGTNTTYPGIFNFYNIGAYSGSNPAVNGLKWASKGTTYLRPWKDRYRSILGGAAYIGTSYIKKGQNTGYLQKFNVTSYERYDHQYMTNVEAAYEEAIKTKKAYAGMTDSPIIFSIPVYENMPAANCPIPS